MKLNVDTDKLVNDFPDTYKDFSVSVNKLTQTMTNITLKNAPLEVPDEEIPILCKFYGKVGDVESEKVSFSNSKWGQIKLTSTTRFVFMKLDPSKKFKNYYWLEGPLPEDQERRITVLHYNQYNSVHTAF